MEPRRRINVPMFLASLGIALGMVLIVIGFRSASVGRDAVRLPPEIEQLNPGDGDQVLRQSRIFVDLIGGYEGLLVVNGIELPVVRLDQLTTVDGQMPAPGEQVELPPVVVYEPGNATLTFTPVEGAPIESFQPGLQQVTVVFWPIEEGRGSSRSYSWTFTVV